MATRDRALTHALAGTAACLAAAAASAAPTAPELINPQAGAGQRAERLAAAPATSGHDGKFFIASDDGVKRLVVGGYTQFRYNVVAGDSRIDDGEDLTTGFELARTRLIFGGAFNDRTTFLILPAINSGASWTVLDAWFRHELDTGLAITVGQQKLPFFREWNVSERFIQPVERSTLSQVYASIYSQGVALETAPDESVFLKVTLSDGLRAINTPLGSPRAADGAALTARAEWVPLGSRAVFGTMSALDTSTPSLLLGASVHWQDETDAFFGTNVDSIFQYTLDVSYEDQGFNATLAVVGRHIDLPSSASIKTEDTFGVFAGAGVFIATNTELFARYAALVPDGDRVADDTFHEITAGLTRYFAGHAAKFTLDAVYYPSSVDDTEVIGFGPSAATGLLQTSGDQLAIRAQMQLKF